MNPSSFFFTIIPLTLIIAILVIVVYYLSRKTEETYYETEMKQLRKALIKRKLNRKTFFYIKDNLKAEDIFINESKTLNDMFKQKKIDSETYVRTKKVLTIGFNEKLFKINEKHNYD